MKPLFHPSTEKTIADLVNAPSQAILLCGPIGSGKGFTAAYIVSQLLNTSQVKLSEHPYVKWLHDQPKAVSIDDIRAAQNFMQLRVPGTQPLRRALIVEQGETMGAEAQNAFLKLLEEPPADSIIIITCTGADQVLPTIRSRTQSITILPPSLSAIESYYSSEYSSNAITKAYHLSEGYMGLMQALLTDDQNHPLIEQITIAKKLLGSSAYDRLTQVEVISKQKSTSLLLQAMERVCHAALTSAVNNNSPQAKRWAARLKAIVAAEKQATHSVQTKLLLTNLMLEL